MYVRFQLKRLPLWVITAPMFARRSGNKQQKYPKRLTGALMGFIYNPQSVFLTFDGVSHLLKAPNPLTNPALLMSVVSLTVHFVAGHAMQTSNVHSFHLPILIRVCQHYKYNCTVTN